MHCNPVYSKIRKNQTRTIDRKYNSKSNQDFNGSQSPRTLVLREIHINLEKQSNNKDRRLQNCESEIFCLTKRSFSACRLGGRNKLVEQIQLQNEHFRDRIRRVQQRIGQVSEKKDKVLRKIESLKQAQTNQISIQIKQISDQNRSSQNSQLCESSLQKSAVTPKKTSRMKISEIRDKINKLEFSAAGVLNREKENKRIKC